MISHPITPVNAAVSPMVSALHGRDETAYHGTGAHQGAQDDGTEARSPLGSCLKWAPCSNKIPPPSMGRDVAEAAA